ncbi:hypothetical protein B0H13DRAFT_1867707 [Mycena leptocephala]|nr:hypothetical protein B0H13DRAFT_1867707 [Mycena leptocephala]
MHKLIMHRVWDPLTCFFFTLLWEGGSARKIMFASLSRQGPICVEMHYIFLFFVLFRHWFHRRVPEARLRGLFPRLGADGVQGGVAAGMLSSKLWSLKRGHDAQTKVPLVPPTLLSNCRRGRAVGEHDSWQKEVGCASEIILDVLKRNQGDRMNRSEKECSYGERDVRH